MPSTPCLVLVCRLIQSFLQPQFDRLTVMAPHLSTAASIWLGPAVTEQG